MKGDSAGDSAGSNPRLCPEKKIGEMEKIITSLCVFAWVIKMEDGVVLPVYSRTDAKRNFVVANQWKKHFHQF